MLLRGVARPINLADKQCGREKQGETGDSFENDDYDDDDDDNVTTCDCGAFSRLRAVSSSYPSVAAAFVITAGNAFISDHAMLLVYR